MNKQSVITNIVAIIGLVLVSWLFFTMIHRVEKKIAFIIDSVELNGHKSLTVGKNSDVSFNRVPSDFLTITPEGDRFQWMVNPEYRDSLQYFKINNDNPNRHPIFNDPKQKIKLNLVTSSGEPLPIEFTGAEVWDSWKKFSKQQDVLARHFATFYHFNKSNGSSHEDSLCWLNQMQQHAVRSFFHRDDDGIAMVILDENTSIKNSNTIITYKRKGNTSSTGEKAHCCKVQFFEVSDHCYKEETPSDGYFNIDGVNYVMKASVKLTEWGAGHVMIKKVKDVLTLHYPRPITIVATVDSLRAKSRFSSGLITLKQNNNSFPTKSDLYLPTFSNAINFDICNLEFSFDSDTVRLRDNNFNTTVVQENFFSIKDFGSSIVPTLKKLNLHSGSDVLTCRVGYIGQYFIYSYLFLPLIVLIVLLCLVWWPWNPKRCPLSPSDSYIYCPDQIRQFRLFLTILMMMCIAYCTCKSLIVLKLSYTFPYFEKLTGIIPASTSLMILLFFSMTMVLNSNYVKQRPFSNLINLVICILLFCGILYSFFIIIDSAINQGMKDSYFNNEITIISNPLYWQEQVGINDTHRSVVYSLIVVETVVLLIWLTLCVWNIVFKQKHLIWKEYFIEMWIKWKLTLSTRLLLLIKRNLWLVGFLRMLSKACQWLTKWFLKLFRPFLIIGIWTIVILICLRINWTYLWSVAIGGRIAIILLIIALVMLSLSFFFSFVYNAFCKTLCVLFPWHFLLLTALVVMGLVMGNFGTAFITMFVIFGLSQALSGVVETVNSNRNSCDIIPRHHVLCQMFMITLFYIAGAMVGDNGYLTNYLGFFLCIFMFFFLVERPDELETNANEQETKRERRWIPVLICVLATYIFTLPLLCSILFSSEKVDYSRMTRRLMLYSNFNDLQKNGFRYSESDAEFMVIMSHYMQQHQTQDPLSNDTHFMHASVSSGQSPVVLNDLSVPIAFFGSYGIGATTIVFFLLLALLMWLNLTYSLSYEDDFKTTILTNAMQWRLLALFMWVGTSLYIYFSYIDWLPFTGRLIPGFGVDAVGEVLETAFLFAFMASVTYKKEE